MSALLVSVYPLGNDNDNNLMSLTIQLYVSKEVKVYFAGSRRYIGTFGSKDDAIYASEVARTYMDHFKEYDLSPEQLDNHFISMREAALEAVKQQQNKLMSATRV